MSRDKLKALRRAAAVKRGFFETDENSLMLVTGIALWASTSATIIVASFIPGVVPENAAFWRLALGIPATIFVIGTAIVGTRLPDRYFYTGVLVAYIPGMFINIGLLMLTPATIAILANIMVPLIYGAYHLKTRDVVWSLALASLIAISALFIAPEGATENIASWLAIYLPLLWAMTFALHRNRLQLRAARRSAEIQARTDTLTGLADQRGLREFAERVLAAGPAEDEVIGLLMIDLDNFRAANTLHGHLGGDHALATIAQHMRQVTPRRSMLARIGGDEFALLLAASSRQRIVEVGEILRGAVRAADIDIALPGVKIDASVGVAVHPEDGETLDELLDAADRRMYSVKDAHHAGRDAAERKARAPLTDSGPSWVTEPGVIEASPHGSLQIWLRTRTQFAQMAAALWGFGSLALALSLLMPDAVVPYPEAAWSLVAIGLVLALLNVVVNKEPGDVVHFLGDAFAGVGIGVLMALTGGFDSPAVLLVILLVISHAWLWGTRLIWLRLASNVAVVVSPLLYSSLDPFPWLTVTAAYAVAVVVITLTLVLFLNDRVILAVGRRSARRASTDALTGISNRRAFNEYVERMLVPDVHGQIEPFAIVMLDLDNFKSVNTNEGHQAGDRVLREIAGQLASVKRADDMLARVGGDEFAAVLRGVGEDVAADLAQRFVDVVQESELTRRYGVGASAGFAVYPQHGTTLDDLMLVADTALMSIKESGKGRARLGQQPSLSGN